MKKINKKTLKGKWVELEEDKSVSFFIRPASIFSMTKKPSDIQDIDAVNYWEMFNYCVQDWKGIVDDDGESLKCDEENKKLYFDFDQNTIIILISECLSMRPDVISPIEAKN